MKVAELFEAYEDVTRREWLKLQQEFIDELPDEWVVDLSETGLVFSHSRGSQAKIVDAQYPFADDSGNQTTARLVAEVETHLSDEGIKYTNVSLNKRVGSMTAPDAEPTFTIKFPSVNDAVEALLDLHSYNLYELIKHRDELESFAKYMQRDITII